MALKSAVAAAVCAVVFGAAGASGALAGEVKGPPTGGAPNTNFNTAATSHANSICVFSGLNDFQNGQVTSPTQTPKDGPPGTPGTACQGGGNPDNQPAPGGPLS
jgi:hypothetical protein